MLTSESTEMLNGPGGPVLEAEVVGTVSSKDLGAYRAFLPV